MKTQDMKKTINCSILLKMALMRFLLATDSPGCRAFTRVEQRMVKLRKELSGVILEHDKSRSHLDAKIVTVDKDLTLKNFEYAGRTHMSMLKSDLAL